MVSFFPAFSDSALALTFSGSGVNHDYTLAAELVLPPIVAHKNGNCIEMNVMHAAGEVALHLRKKTSSEDEQSITEVSTLIWLQSVPPKGFKWNNVTIDLGTKWAGEKVQLTLTVKYNMNIGNESPVVVAINNIQILNNTNWMQHLGLYIILSFLDNILLPGIRLESDSETAMVEMFLPEFPAIIYFLI